jgi:hypothetical protein
MNRIRRIQYSVVLVAALLASACDEGSSLAIQIADHTFEPADQLTVTLFEDDRIRMFERTDFRPIPLRASSDVGPYAVDSEGMATMRAVLRRGDVTLATGSVDVQLGDEEDWRVIAFRSVTDPRPQFCVVCQNAASFPIATAFQRAPGEALWLVW